MNQTVCTLCFKTIWDDFQTIGDIKHIVDKLLLKLNLNISKEIVLCKECADNLQVYANFKIACIYTKTRIFPQTIVTNSVGMSVIDIGEKNSLNSIVDTEDQIRCCFCKETTARECLVSLNKSKENVFIIKMLKEYLELDLSNGEEILTCKTCVDSLQGLSRFIVNCLSAEDKRSNHIEVETDVVDKVEIDSAQLKHTFKSTVKYKSRCIDMNDIKVKCEGIQEGILMRNNHEIKYENCMDNRQLNINTEHVDIESEQNDCNSFPEPPREASREDNRKFQCKICAFNTGCEMDLKRHRSTHAVPSATIYKCEVCLFETKYNWDFNHHLQTHKNSSETIQLTTYKCNICEYKTHHEGSYNVHTFSHKNPTVTIYKCELCTFETNFKVHIQTHTTLNHKNSLADKVFQCVICKYTSRWKPQLRKHLLRHVDLSGTDTYKCEMCCFETKIKLNISTHMLSHAEYTLIKSNVKILRCEECTYETRHRSCLNRHVVLMHSSTPMVKLWLKCDKCEFKTQRWGYLKQHKSVHVDPSEMLECDVCAHKSRRKCDHKRHMLSHKNLSDKTLRCDKCLYKGKHKGYLKRHMLTHVGTSVKKDI